MAKLFIEGQEVELTDDVQFLLNKQWEDISDPTTIINDWSKTVTLPGSSRNNRIFGHLYRPDRTIGTGGGMGVDFNPYKQLDMRLEQGSDVVMEGYAKMNAVTMGKDGIKYDITLFGSLGKVFTELQKITFDRSTDASGYLIHGEDYVNTSITKDVVKSCFESTGQTSTGATGDITNIIGFAPNSAMMDDFDYKTYQSSDTMSNLFKDALYSTFQATTGISPENAIGEGLTPRGIGEYRSYQQLPFIYFNKLWRIFQAKAEAVTGWTFNLDNRWFNTTNPYWYNVVMMLQNLGTRKAEAATNNLYSLYVSQLKWDSYPYTSKQSAFSVDVIGESVPMYIQESNLWSYNNSSYIYRSDSACKVRIGAPLGGTDGMEWVNGKALQLFVQYQIPGGSAQTLPIAILCHQNDTQFDSGGVPVYKMAQDPPSSASSIAEFPGISNVYYWEVNINSIPQPNNHQFLGQPCIARLVAQWVNNEPAIIGYQYGGSWIEVSVDIYMSFNIQDGVKQQQVIKVTKNKGSYSNFTLNDLWNNDYNPFDIILRYCKMFRIGVYADNASKQLRFMRIEDYLAEGSGTTLDWSGKVDYSKDIKLQPMVMDTKYIRLGYDDPDTAIGELYKKKYGIAYGDMRLETAYRFNTEVKDLFEGLLSPIEATLQTLSWTTLLANRVAYTVSGEPFVDCMDEEGKYIDSFGRLFLHLGRKAFEGGEMRTAQITDDTPLQRASDKKFYTQGITGYGTEVTYYPNLVIHNGTMYLTFGIPKEIYTYGDFVPSGSKGVYTRRWEKYMNERYDFNNKLVTCYVRLTPMEYASFKHNQFVRIGTQLYFVNKIADYDLSANQPTKVELITIQNRFNYYGTNG